jgi:tetratricopeptide (TPR) repeat protein/TolB-like protein
MYSIVHEDPIPLKELRPDASDDLDVICQRCLEKDPALRLPSADEILSLLGFTSSPPRLRRVLSRTGFAAIVGAIALIAAIWFVMQQFFPPAPQGQLRVGVLPFQNLTQKPELDSLSTLLQVMLVGELTGMEGVGVVEPLSLNTVLKSSFGGIITARPQEIVRVAQSMEITYLVDGNVATNDTSTILQTFVRNLLTGEQTFSRSGPVSSEEDLSPAVRVLAREIASYLQVKEVGSSREKELLPWTARQPTRALAVAAFLQANQYIFEGVPGAEKHLRRAIEVDSSYIAPRIWFISGLLQKGRLDEAQEQYRILLSMEKNASPFEQSMITWAGDYLKGDLGGQSQALKMALRYSPRNNIILMNLARTRYLLGDLDGTIELLTPVIESRWQYSPAHYLLALCYDVKQQPSRAKEILEQSLTLPPVYHDSYLLLAKYALTRNDSLRALQYENQYHIRAREVGVGPGRIFFALAVNRSSLGSYHKALEYFASAMNADPRNIIIRQGRADVLLAMNRTPEAAKEYRALLKKDSSLVHCYHQLGSISLQQGDTAAALEQYRKFLKWDSTSQESEAVKQRILQLSQ